ncbi:helix-turn-helix domain-containing protein [Arenimonas sp. SCN 70-307]|uniref:helix-turn-helix domain-containing protein n=1 Tax=Arenimonas sp. SCN 70-307 TaxID=1660089 RepID=UPI0025B966FB|nr:helix-turn-helix domain-containing protein [Arenimonas sp. SCN 70-307]
MTPEKLGRQLRQQRQSLGLTLEECARRTGLSLRLLSEMERGKEGVSIGRVVRYADSLGMDLQARPGEAARVDVERFPELKLLAWQRPGQRFLDERDALALYEANWRFVDSQHLIPREAELIRQLSQRHGAGVLNV